MQQKNLIKSKRYWGRELCIATLALIFLGTGCVSNAQAQDQMVLVKVLIEEASFNGCGDPFDPPDIYWDLYIHGFKKSSYDDQIEVNLAPFGVMKEFSYEIPLKLGTIGIVIEQWDADLDAADQCDINPNRNEKLSFDLNLATCKITGDLSFDCGVSQELWGNGVEWFKFKITVEDPPHVPGLNVRCLHDPIWPQPGQPVTITAEALDDDAHLMTAGKVDNIVVWINDNTAPYASTAGTPAAGANTLSITYSPLSGAQQFAYGCRVFDDGKGVYTGGRIVQIGKPAKGRAVPILYTGPSDRKIDIAFIPQAGTFAGEDEPGFPDPEFLTRVHALIRDGYYAGRVEGRGAGRLFLTQQNMMNFWITLDMGDTGGYADIQPPDNWSKDYNFIDTGALLHANTGQTDSAYRNIRIFTTDVSKTNWEVLAPRTLLHESGHAPFGLSDEYCKKGSKSESYFVADPLPNVYDDQAKCFGDSLAAGVTDACQQIKDNTQGCSVDYFRLESASTFYDDLMTCSGHLTPNPADVRRINWLFDKCRNASCD